MIFKSLHLQVLPPLKDVKIRPEIGTTIRNKLVRLMTHVDMGVKQTAAEFLFVLCKESGEQEAGAVKIEERVSNCNYSKTYSHILCVCGVVS